MSSEIHNLRAELLDQGNKLQDNYKQVIHLQVRAQTHALQWGGGAVYYSKYNTLFWQSLRIILYLYFISVKYFKNTLLWHEKDQKYFIYTFFP